MQRVQVPQRSGAGKAAVRLSFAKIKRSQNHAKKEPRSELLVDDAGILADPSDAGVFGVHAFDERAGVNVGAETVASCQLPVVSCVWPGAQFIFNLYLYLPQAALDGVVVIFAGPCVA